MLIEKHTNTALNTESAWGLFLWISDRKSVDDWNLNVTCHYLYKDLTYKFACIRTDKSSDDHFDRHAGERTRASGMPTYLSKLTCMNALIYEHAPFAIVSRAGTGAKTHILRNGLFNVFDNGT